LNQNPSHGVTLAVVHTPFRPVGYVLVHAHLLLPAVWHDPAQSAPATGSRVVVNVPYGKPAPDLPPLIAYPAAPAIARPANRQGPEELEEG